MLKSKIDKKYEKHNCERACQGDIIRDIKIRIISDDNKVEEISLPYIVLLTQDCDLEQHINNIKTNEILNNLLKNNQHLPNILIVPAFSVESIRSGEHLKDLFNVIQDRITSEPLRKIKNNNDDRYHFLPAYVDFQIPDLIIDFKIYFSIQYNELIKFYHGGYLGTINELFRERLSQRFTNHLGRIGLPEI